MVNKQLFIFNKQSKDDETDISKVYHLWTRKVSVESSALFSSLNGSSIHDAAEYIYLPRPHATICSIIY